MVVRALASDAQWPAELDAASSQLLVVDFFATWCGPCRTIAPFVEQLSNRYPDVVFLKVDVDKCPNTAQSAGVSAMPTFVFYVSRAKVDTLRGADQIDLTGFIMKESVECLNESDSFTLKHMLDGVCALKSDCDEQLLISLPLRQPVRLHSIAIRGAGDADAGAGAAGPRTIKIFCNTLQMLDFDAAEGAEPQQTVELETKHVDNGDVFNLRYVKFQNVHNVILFVRDNQDGSEVTEIGSIKLYGTPVQATNMSDFKRLSIPPEERFAIYPAPARVKILETPDLNQRKCVMGTCPSSAASSRLLATSPVPIHGAAVNKQINQRLREDCKKNRRDVKVLLLGAADCGKSTILKQVRLLHADPFDWVELEMTKPLVYDTIFTNIRCMISAMGQMSIGAIQAEVAASRLLTMIDNRGLGDDLDAQSVSDLKVLWRDSDFIAAFEGRSELQVDDSLRYFMNDLDRIAQPGYVPSTQDVLYVRRRTTGVSKVTIKMKSSTCLHIFDVGGQRSERRKWLHLFDDVTALIFIIAINEYNQMLLEDKSVNRLEEALNLYRQIVGCVWFNKTFVVTFLNKIDLFKEKLQKVPLNVLFKSYTGGTNYDVAINFLDDIVSKIFLSTNAELTRRIYIHYTCATDTYQVEKIIKSVIDIVMTINTANSGMV